MEIQTLPNQKAASNPAHQKSCNTSDELIEQALKQSAIW
jgi:hypothetical protein